MSANDESDDAGDGDEAFIALPLISDDAGGQEFPDGAFAAVEASSGKLIWTGTASEQDKYMDQLKASGMEPRTFSHEPWILPPLPKEWRVNADELTYEKVVRSKVAGGLTHKDVVSSISRPKPPELNGLNAGKNKGKGQKGLGIGTSLVAMSIRYAAASFMGTATDKIPGAQQTRHY